ncbi:yehC [Acrasis kona]|uniref:YehC n=1 Tax=Acrasis kona TaxID=1008807 RepID=A0AAW2YK32_9EUKA
MNEEEGSLQDNPSPTNRDTQTYHIRSETMEELLKEGLEREHLLEESINDATTKRNNRKRKSTIDTLILCGPEKRIGPHHTQVYKVRFEPQAFTPTEQFVTHSNSPPPPTSPSAQGSNTNAFFQSNEYQEFERGQHSTQIKEMQKDSKVKYKKHYW